MRIKISKKETKEGRFWLNLAEPYAAKQDEREVLITESTELI